MKPEPEGLLAVWHDVAEGSEALVTDWYNTEHHDERLGVEGFLEAKRYRLCGGKGRQFLSLYRTRSPAVLTSAPYLARLADPSPRTQDIMPRYRNVTRSVFRLALSLGQAQGGCIAALAGPEPAADAKSVSEVFAALLQRPGILRCRWLLAESPSTSANGTPEATLRGNADARVGWAIVIEANEPQDALGAIEFIEGKLPSMKLAQRAAYRLVYANQGERTQ